jgi:6-phosphofructokinase 1
MPVASLQPPSRPDRRPTDALKNGRYDNIPIDTVTATKKLVNVKEHYNIERLRPHYKSFEMKPLFIMTSDAC